MIPMAEGGGRNGLSTLLVVLATVCFGASLLAVYAEAVLFDADTFADRSVAVLDEPAVQRVVVDRLLDEAERQAPEVASVRGPAEQATAVAVQTPLFGQLLGTAVRETHQIVFDGQADDTVQVVVDYSAALEQAVTDVAPELAGFVPDDLQAELLSVQDAALLTRAADTAEDARTVAFVLPLVTIGLAAGAVLVAGDRVRTVRNLGIGAAVVGAGLLLVLTLGRSLLEANVPSGDVRDGARAIWDILLNDLRRTSAVAALAGAAVAVTAALVPAISR